jgi:hypothetical protein
MTEATERTVELSPTLRTLVDERLDGIERALRTANMPRVERLKIVEDVERQLLDMLAEASDRPSRRDVLQALARLDPPEAYLAEQPQSASSDNLPEPAANKADPLPRTGYSRLASSSLVVLGMTFIFFGVAIFGLFAHSAELWIFGGSLALLSALISLGLGVAALVTLRREPKRGTGFAVLAVVVSVWVLALGFSDIAAEMLSSVFAGFVLLVAKDLLFGTALIWCLRSVLKGAAAKTSA